MSSEPMDRANADSRLKEPPSGIPRGVGERLKAWAMRNDLPTEVPRLGPPTIPNPQPESRVGNYRSPDSRRAVLADMDFIMSFVAEGKPIPSLLEAGPRQHLYFDPATVRAAIVTSGGVAPGLNRVVHSIVSRHFLTYGLDPSREGAVFGVFDGMAGLVERPLDMMPLTPDETGKWLNDGGSCLGARREYRFDKSGMAQKVAENIRSEGIRILYIIGGDGSLGTAEKFYPLVPDTAVIGLPKTMDNDIPWVGQSFGFSTSVDKAAEIITAMHTEAAATGRVGVVELFGAESGFVAANAAMASGRAALVLVPEMFAGFKTAEEIERAFERCLEFLREKVRRQDRAGAIVVIAEGMGPLLAKRGVNLMGKPIDPNVFAQQVASRLQRDFLFDSRGRAVTTFVNRPRHHIRAIAPNAADRTYCERLGAMAVETALAGYTGCMVSWWLNEYVLIPLALSLGKRSLTTGGLFWKQIVLGTGQPDISPEAD
ncbi:MAG TPA: 6-phosphofructokinase [Verrucomicrobiales bacterium]|nr:6-phosphofructokinase [Verrucomicrobiales bacterium]